MHFINSYDLFLFDLDGLLVDSERLHYEAYKQMCAANRYTLEWDFFEYLEVAHTSHEGLQKALHAKLGEEKSWDHYYSEKKRLYLELLSGGMLRLMPGVEPLLEALAAAGKKRCVVTHSPHEQVEKMRKLLPQLESIPHWYTREDYENPKPNPDGYLKAIKEHAEPGDQIIGFEDSLRGLQALKQTRSRAILVCDEKHPQLAQIELSEGDFLPTL